MDESHNMSLVNQAQADGDSKADNDSQAAGKPAPATDDRPVPIAEVSRFAWNTQTHSFARIRSNAKAADRHAIPSDEVREILNLVISLKSEYRTEMFGKICSVCKLMMFLTMVWYLIALIVVSSSGDSRSGAGEVITDVLLFMAAILVQVLLYIRLAAQFVDRL